MVTATGDKELRPARSHLHKRVPDGSIREFLPGVPFIGVAARARETAAQGRTDYHGHGRHTSMPALKVPALPRLHQQPIPELIAAQRAARRTQMAVDPAVGYQRRQQAL